ncbi:MAG: hypothetical protein ACI8Q9_002632, partial [Planctomycetota bacterium]
MNSHVALKGPPLFHATPMNKTAGPIGLICV